MKIMDEIIIDQTALTDRFVQVQDEISTTKYYNLKYKYKYRDIYIFLVNICSTYYNSIYSRER